jgi:hypothetical protein
MAAPTKPCDVKISLVNPEPSTHGGVADVGVSANVRFARPKKSAFDSRPYLIILIPRY